MYRGSLKYKQADMIIVVSCIRTLSCVKYYLSHYAADLFFGGVLLNGFSNRTLE